MSRPRFLVPAPKSVSKPSLAFYHCMSRVVDRKFVLGSEQKEHIRILMRMYERFSGCRVLA